MLYNTERPGIADSEPLRPMTAIDESGRGPSRHSPGRRANARSKIQFLRRSKTQQAPRIRAHESDQKVGLRRCESLAPASSDAIGVGMKSRLWIVRTRGWAITLLVVLIILLAIGVLATP